MGVAAFMVTGGPDGFGCRIGGPGFPGPGRPLYPLQIPIGIGIGIGIEGGRGP